MGIIRVSALHNYWTFRDNENKHDVWHVGGIQYVENINPWNKVVSSILGIRTSMDNISQIFHCYICKINEILKALLKSLLATPFGVKLYFFSTESIFFHLK